MNQALRTKLAAVKAALIASNWTFAFSVMSDSNGLNYGSCFIKDGCKVYLNKDTVDAYAIAYNIA
jgi:hypothetical protein